MSEQLKNACASVSLHGRAQNDPVL